MTQTEIEQMRARVAAAWGVDVGSVIGRDGGDYYVGGFERREWGGVVFFWHVNRDEPLLEIEENSNTVFVSSYHVKRIGVLSHEIQRRATRFLYSMNYDIQFLIDAGVTVTAHDQLEWALQMRDAGFPLG